MNCAHCYNRLPLRPHEQYHRTSDVAQYVVRHGADQHSPDAGPSMRRHHDDVASQIMRKLDYRLTGFALKDELKRRPIPPAFRQFVSRRAEVPPQIASLRS